MAFRVQADGSIECDAAEEAVQLARLLRAPAEHSPAKTQAARSTARTLIPDEPAHTGDGTLESVWKSLSEGPRKFLQKLAEAGEAGLTSDELREQLGYETAKSLPPIVRFVAKSAETSRVDQDRVMVRTTTFVNRKPVSRYMASKELRTMLGISVISGGAKGGDMQVTK